MIQNLSKYLIIKAQLEPTLIRFFVNLIYIAIITFVALAALGKLGIKTTSFIAVLGAAGLVMSLALQGSLCNFASGVFMIVFRPFKVHDYIEGEGKEYEWLGLAYSQVLQRVTFNLSSVFVNFFEGRAKFPNFKSKQGKQLIQYPQNVKLMPEDSVIKFPGNLGLM